jgi:hypothetical protein
MQIARNRSAVRCGRCANLTAGVLHSGVLDAGSSAARIGSTTTVDRAAAPKSHGTEKATRGETIRQGEDVARRRAGSADVRAVRMHDDGRAQERQVHVLPVHRVSRSPRQRVRPRGALGGPTPRRRSTRSSCPNKLRSQSRTASGRARPIWGGRGSERRDGSSTASGRCKRRSTADTTITSRAGSPTRCGLGNPQNGKPSSRR